MIVVIALYNLSKRSPGLANLEHFHFRTHITNFIDTNWETFFSDKPRRKHKNLLGTIAGILSQHSPEIFMSGTETVGFIGWWKLSHKWNPSEYNSFLQNKVKRSSSPEDEEIEVKRQKINEDLSSEDTAEESKIDSNDRKDARVIFDLEESNTESPAHETFQLDIGNESELIEFLHPGSNRDIKSFDESEEMLQIEELSTTRATHNLTVECRPQSILTPKTDFNQQYLDRYRAFSTNDHQILLAGRTIYERFHSPFSGRILSPFIYRDKKTFPQWLKLMCEVKFSVTDRVPERSTIDFCYARPHHLSAVNSLLQRTFWPGIDISDCLNYPDFTVVALYKKLIVGCAFLVPDACHNEAYISFLAVRPGFSRSGIGSFMLYHLTQTSHGKDITLHVSASNPAICLFQKFGFKTEEFILGFYEKYLPPDSPHSPHALFLRLAR